MAFPKFQTKEVLNKVLNSGEDALNVNLSTATVTVDSEFPDAAAITDAFANPTTTSSMSMLMGWNSATWDRVIVKTATSDSDPDLDGLNLLGTHALLSARKDASTTVGLTAADGTHNALHVAITDGSNALVMQAAAGETEDEDTNAITSVSTIYGYDSEGSSNSKLRAAQVVIDNGAASATPNVLLTGAHYKASLDTYADNDASPLHVNSKGSLLTNLHDGTTAAGIDGTTGGLKVDLYGEGGATISASNPVFTELTDGSAAISTSNPLSVNITDGTNALVMQADADETEDERINAITSISTVYGFDSEGSTGAKLRAVQVAVDNAGLSATPNVLVSGGIYKAALDTYADNDASPLHFDASGRLLISGDATLGTTTYSETSTKGITVGAVRNDTLATLANTDNEIAPLQVNAAGALYTADATGEAGSILCNGTDAVAATISNTCFIAIQFLEDTVFHDTDGLVATDATIYPDDNGTGAGISSGGGGAVTDDQVFPQGMTIFGRWSGFKLASGAVIGYIGYI